MGDWLNWLYTDVTQKLEAKDFSTLQEAHACTAGLKAVTTSVTAVCIKFNLSNPCALLLVINGLLVHLMVYFHQPSLALLYNYDSSGAELISIITKYS